MPPAIPAARDQGRFASHDQKKEEAFLPVGELLLRSSDAADNKGTDRLAELHKGINVEPATNAPSPTTDDRDEMLRELRRMTCHDRLKHIQQKWLDTMCHRSSRSECAKFRIPEQF